QDVIHKAPDYGFVALGHCFSPVTAQVDISIGGNGRKGNSERCILVGSYFASFTKRGSRLRVGRRPSARLTCVLKPSFSLTRSRLAHIRDSPPSSAGMCSGTKTRPITPLMASTRSFTFVSTPLPTLMTSRSMPGAVEAV